MKSLLSQDILKPDTNLLSCLISSRMIQFTEPPAGATASSHSSSQSFSKHSLSTYSVPGTGLGAENRDSWEESSTKGPLRCAVPLACDLTYSGLTQSGLRGNYIRVDL